MPSYLSYLKNVAFDAKDDDIQEWITVRGNHIPIKKGQTKEEAVKSFIEHQAGKNDVPQGVKWTPTNKKGEGTGNKKTEEKSKYNIQHGAKISDIESMINHYADNKAYSSWEEEEQFIAEKLKQEGIYAYGNQIKEAMKNVYGEEYEDAFKISTPENSKEDIAKMAKSQQKNIPEEVGFGALEIAYNDVDFGSNADTNKKLLLNAIHESGHEEEAAIAKLVESMPTDNFKDVESFRKALSGERNDASAHVAAMHKFQAETGIAPEDYEAYEGVRQSGITNMFDVGTVMQLSGLPRNKVLDIMKHYSEARKVYGDDED